MIEFEKKIFDKEYWCPVLLTTILCFGFTLTNYAIGIDDPTPQFIWYMESYRALLMQGRWGYKIISLLVNISEFLPCWMDLLSVFIYLLTDMIWVNLFFKVSGSKFQKISGVIFACLYISFPYLARIFIYMSADLLSACNMLFASLAVQNIWKVFEEQKEKRKNFILAITYIAIGYGFYESTIVYFICGVMILFFLKYKYISIDKFSLFLNKMVLMLGIGLGGIFFSKIILYFILKYYGMNGIEYAGGYIAYTLEKNIIIQIWDTIQKLIYGVFRGGELVDFTLRISIIIIILISMYTAIKKKNMLPLVIAIGMIVSNFAIILVTGNLDIMNDTKMNKQRILVTYGLFTSFSISMIYSIVMEINVEKGVWYKEIQRLLRYLTLFGMLILILRQSRQMHGIFWVDYQRAELDRQKAGYINYEVEKTDWKRKPVIFVGYSDDYLVTKDKDPLSSYFNFFKQWTDVEIHNYTSFYMSGVGYVYPIGLEEGMLENALQKSVQQPSYPMDGYVKEYDNYIVVKLGPSN